MLHICIFIERQKRPGARKNHETIESYTTWIAFNVMYRT